MILSNEELKNIYFGAYEFEETGDGYLQAFQYSKEQVEYFKGAFEMWYERCTASSAKTLEFTTWATTISFDYKFIWKCSLDSFELMVDGLITDIAYCEKIKKIVSQYKNIRVIEGMKLVPHLPEYFLDNLHPNCLGCEWYGRNLVKEIQKMGF